MSEGKVSEGKVSEGKVSEAASKLMYRSATPAPSHVTPTLA